jgi:hypothetical protein
MGLRQLAKLIGRRPQLSVMRRGQSRATGGSISPSGAHALREPLMVDRRTLEQRAMFHTRTLC